MAADAVGAVISGAARGWLRLALARGVGPVTGRRLVRAVGSVSALWGSRGESRDCLQGVEGVGDRLRSAIRNSSEGEATAIAAFCRARGIGMLCPDDGGWPAMLEQADDAPLLLFYRGDASSLCGERMLAVVGARRAGREGCLIARRWSAYLAERGVTIVSGMAFGIDAAAHGGALEAKGKTVAVLGSGLSALSEQQQRQVDAIAACGCVISEFLPELTARPEQFPRRNRIIAALAHATLVVEADQRSGSLITAHRALDYGRDLFAVPGSILAGNHAGCHQLIRDGAELAEHADELLQTLGWQGDVADDKRSGKRYQPVDRDEAQLLAALAGGTLHLDHLAESCGLTVPEISPIVLRLELAGAIERLPGSRYSLSVELHRT